MIKRLHILIVTAIAVFGVGVRSVCAADTTAPTIMSITRHDPLPENTSDTTVTFRVTFSEAVTGVDASDFALSGTAATNATIDSVTAQTQTIYDITATVSQQGTLSLSVRTAVDNIQDLAGNAYDDAVGSSQRYIIDTVPKIVSIVRHTPTDEKAPVGALVYRVTFNEAVQNVDVTDFDVIGTASATVTGVTAVSSSVYDVAVTATTEGTLELIVVSSTDITDGATSYGGTIDSSESYTLVVAPTVTHIVRHDPTTETANRDEVTFRVTFSEAVTGVDASDFALSGTAAEKSKIIRVVPVSLSVYDVTVSVVDGTISVMIDDDVSIKDIDNNSYVASTITPETYTIGYAPVITISAKTKQDTRAVEDTAVTITDDTAISVENISVDGSTTVTVNDFSCTQKTTTTVKCSMRIEGVGSLVIRAVDSHGNASTVAENGYRITRDVSVHRPKFPRSTTKKRSVKLSKHRTAYFVKRRVTFSGTSEELSGGMVKIYHGKTKLGSAKISTSDGTWKTSITFKEGKKYKLTFKFYDSHGEKITQKGAYKVFVDATKPTFESMPSRLTKRPGQKVWWKATDNHKIKRYRYTFRGARVKTSQPFFYIPRSTPRGTYSLEIRAYDKAGNRTDKTVTIVVR